jgi:hypothetical protein
MKYMKAEDELDPIKVNGHAQNLDLQRLLGIWMNTHRPAQGLTRIEITANGSKLLVRAFATGDPIPADWGEVEADHIYANNMTSSQAAGFVAHYRFNVANVDIEANWNQGLLVVGSFTRFKNAGQRSNYFSREFFHQ